MIEGRIKALVERLLGEWIESDKLDLRINVLQDENVRCHNVNLKESVIPNFLPFRLKAGLIGSLALSIPFKSLGTKPAKATLSDVLVILSPRQLNEAEKVNEIQDLKLEKRATLEKDVLERIHGPPVDKTQESGENKKKDDAPEGYYGADGFFGRLVTKLVDNLQVELRNVHIRFEGERESKFAVGFSIGALYAETTGSNWRTGQYTNGPDENGDHIVFKLIQAINLSAYIDPRALHFVHSSKHPKVLHVTLARLKTMADMNTNIHWWTQHNEQHTHRFVLAPFHVTLKLTMNMALKTLQSSIPRYDMLFEITKLIAMLDNEQMVLINWILDSFSLHDQWRNAIACSVLAEERRNMEDETLTTKYLAQWEAFQKLYSKQSNWETIKKSEQWKQLVILEQLMPLDTVVLLRNMVNFPVEITASHAESNQSVLADLGQVFNVPTPEISLKFDFRKDLGLKLKLVDGVVVVEQCFGQAKDMKFIKPGMILIKVNNKELVTFVEGFTSLEDLHQKLGSKIGENTAILTFRHPEVVPAIVTPDQIVSCLRFVANEVELRLVLSTARKVVTSATFHAVQVTIQGFGPGLWSYHSYSIVSQHFYLQESIASVSSCIISSVDKMRSTPQSKPSLRFRMNYLEKDHPAVVPSDISTYATEYGLHIGDIVIVYDAKRFQKFMAALSEFSTLAFPPRPQISLASFVEDTNSTTASDVPRAASPTNIKYTASFGSLRCFVGCAAVPMRRATSTSKPSYQSIFSQLTIHNTTTTIQDWLRENFMLEQVVRAMVHLQRYVRGAMVRSVALPRLSNKTRRLVRAIKKEVSIEIAPTTHLLEAYIYKEDYRLGCRRWEELYFVLEKNGVLRIYKDNSLASYIDCFLVEQLQSVVISNEFVVGPITQETLHYLKLTFLVEFQVHNTIQEAPPHTSSIEILLAFNVKSTMEWWKLNLESLREQYKNNTLDTSSREPRRDKIGLRQHIMSKFPMDVHKGWLFRQDLSLAFRRWHEYFVCLDEYGVLRFYENHTGKVLIGEEYVEQVDSVLHVGNISQMVDWESINSSEVGKEEEKKNLRESVRIKHVDFEHLGPSGDSASTISYCLEVTLKSESIVDGKKSTTISSFLLASYSAKELADWRQSLFVKCQAVRSQSVDISRRRQRRKLGWPTWLRSHLPFTFTNTLKPCHNKNVWAMYSEMSSWISLYASGVSLSFCQHYPSEATLEEAGAFSVDFSVNKLEVRDRRWQRAHSVLYLGDTFLEYEHGKLQAVAITTEHLDNKGSLKLTAFYRGPSMLASFNGCSCSGLDVDLIFSGCLMPHDFSSAITDALQELSPLWTSESSTSAPAGAPEPYLRVPNANLDVQIPMLEAYFEEKHCVAKLTMEKNKLVYSTTPEAEKLDLHLGSMSLYVMTKDNQLRLAQIESFQIKYEFMMASLQRQSTITIGQIKLEADGRMRILYQLFEALQHTEEDEYDDVENVEYMDEMAMIQTPPDSPSRVVELTPHSPASSTRFKRPKRVESQYSARSIQSVRSYRARPSQRSLQSLRSEYGNGPIVQYIGPILSFQSFIALSQPSLHRMWHQVQDTINVDCEAIVFEVVKRSLSRVAMDTYIPVMKLSLSKLSILGSTGSEFKFDYLSTVNVVLLARYYNTALADWEPLVEPWMITMDVSKSPNQQLSINLKARERLNINFTEALVRLLCSVQKHRKLALPSKQNGFLLPPTAEQYECVSVWNNLGVPIRLANLNTSNPGELTVEFRDGWSLPHYTRFHDVQVEAVLLPWWSPQECSGVLDSLSHTFKMEYGGANAGVAPKLRVKVSALIEKHEHAVQMQLDGTQAMISEENTNANDKWVAIGTVELNLSGSLMGTSDPESKRIKFCQWHRLRDSRGVITGEILVALHFTPKARPLSTSQTTVLTVASGGSLTVDPFRLGSQVNTRESADGDSKMSVKLPESIRNGYVPPLALEVLIDNSSRSLLCPLQRAGKFFIRGENVVAEVKVAQRDEFRRVLMLSSPKQLKNLTGLSMNVGTFPSTDLSNFAAEDEADLLRSRSISIVRKESMTPVPPGGKYSLPLSALYSDLEHCLVLQVMQSKRTKIVDISDLHKKVGCHIVYLQPLSSSSWGYCLFMEIVEHVRNVYREQQYDMNVPGQLVSNVSEVDEIDIMGHDAKYQVRLHAGFVFENALPIRLRYKVEMAVSNGLPILLCEGTLAPGEEVELYQFHKNANIFLSLPEEASDWSPPISLARCISQEATHISNQTISAADLPNQRRSTDTIPFYKRSFDPNSFIPMESHIFTARMDYTVADNGSPRTVLYATVWVYNYSQVGELLVRSAESTTQITTCRKLLPDSTPRLMDCPLLVLEMSTIFEHEVARWSDKIHASVVGVQRSATLRSVKSKREVGVSIHRPLGQFHRSTQVVVTPRYVFVNDMSTKFEVSTEKCKDDGNSVIEPLVREMAYDFPGDSLLVGRKIRLKAGGGSDANYLNSSKWSGYFSIDEEQEFSLWLPDVVPLWPDTSTTVNVPRIRVKIYSVGASMVIKLARDDPPMLMIDNTSAFSFKVFQYGGSANVIVEGFQTASFAWEQPDQPRRIACMMVERRADGKYESRGSLRFCDFDSLDREETIVWDVQGQVVVGEVKFKNASRVLAFRHVNKGEFVQTKFRLDVHVLAVRRAIELTNDDKRQGYMKLMTDTKSDQVHEIGPKTINQSGIYRFESKSTITCIKRPRELRVELIEAVKNDNVEEVPPPPLEMIDISDPSVSMTPQELQSPTGSFHKLSDDEGKTPMESRWPHFARSTTTGLHQEFVDELSVGCPVNPLDDGMYQLAMPKGKNIGSVDIKLPKKVWKQFQQGTERSLSDQQGYWWNLMSDDGQVVGQVQISLKFGIATMKDQEHSHREERQQPATVSAFQMSIRLSSLAISFVHNTYRLDVAYLSMQRINAMYSALGGSSEVALAIGNLQMDNQIDRKVVLGPRGVKRKEGVSVRLRDRWKSCLNHQYRGIYEQVDVQALPVVQFRMLYNDQCHAGAFHVELAELIMQEIEITTDEKFVVSLINVFGGIESLSSSETFASVVDQRVFYSEPLKSDASPNESTPIADGIYIEQLDIESIRILFSLELNGGKHIATLGPSGRRLAMYLPVSNVKDMRLNFSKLFFAHIFESKAIILDKLYRHYHQQALYIVLQGLYTVSLFVNPFRIVYRLGHGFLEVVRLPTRGLASGSPIELVSGAYLGVRSLAMNTISASYETFAGATGVLAAVVAPMIVNEDKKNKFMEEMVNFQRAVMGEVEAFDAAEERHMSKYIMRAPRVFTGIGLLVEYGPGALPKEDQMRVDLQAAVLVQQWWRRHRLCLALFRHAAMLKQAGGTDSTLAPNASRSECIIL